MAHVYGCLRLQTHFILFDSNLEPKLTDLGLSRKITEKSWSKPGFTLIYCSPEQIKGHNPDKKSDVWSFGMTIYSFLTHLSPYDYLTNNGKKKLDKNEYYNEIYYNKRIPKIPDNFKIQYPGIFKLMEDMWKTDPEQRPNIKQVRQSLVNFFLQI